MSPLLWQTHDVMHVHSGDTVLPSGTGSVFFFFFFFFFFFKCPAIYLNLKKKKNPKKGGALLLTKKRRKIWQVVTHLSPRTKTYLGILRQVWEVTHDGVCLGDSISTWRLHDWFIAVTCFVGVHSVVLTFKLHTGGKYFLFSAQTPPWAYLHYMQCF